MVFPLSWLILISFFRPNYLKLSLSTVNKCTMVIMMTIMINIKNFLEIHFCGVSINSFRIWTFVKLFCIQPLWCTAKLVKVHVMYLVLTKEIGQIWHLWHEPRKSAPKALKPKGINYIMIKDLDLWQILAKVLLEFIR